MTSLSEYHMSLSAYHITSLSAYHITSLSAYYVTISVSYNVTISVSYHVTISIPYHVSISVLCHYQRITISISYHVTIRASYHVTISFFHAHFNYLQLTLSTDDTWQGWPAWRPSGDAHCKARQGSAMHIKIKPCLIYVWLLISVHTTTVR